MNHSCPNILQKHTLFKSVTFVVSIISTSGDINLTVYSESIGVGHAFISISQGSNLAVYGYYPKASRFSSLNGSGIMGEMSDIIIIRRLA